MTVCTLGPACRPGTTTRFSGCCDHTKSNNSSSADTPTRKGLRSILAHYSWVSMKAKNLNLLSSSSSHKWEVYRGRQFGRFSRRSRNGPMEASRPNTGAGTGHSSWPAGVISKFCLILRSRDDAPMEISYRPGSVVHRLTRESK
jgi:hypothetical protein